jgi:hypothetical protein
MRFPFFWTTPLSPLLIALLTVMGCRSQKPQHGVIGKDRASRSQSTASLPTNCFTFARNPIYSKDAWDSVPVPDITGSNATSTVEKFIAQYGDNMSATVVEFTYGLVKTERIRGLPWEKIKDREFQAVTSNGILYVALESFAHNCGGVAYNPHRKEFNSSIKGFKPIGNHWYVWAQPEDPITLPKVYEGL